MKCKYCNSFESDNKGTFINHCAYCDKNPNPKTPNKVLDKARRSIKRHSNQYKKAKETGIPYVMSEETRKLISKNSKGYKHTEESKRKMSEGRKKWLKENPDKHPWKNKDKFTSEPCTNLKKILTSRGIQFASEFEPIEEHAYSIDICFPDKKIGIEVNGNQHYNRDGSLKEYYQKRHDEIEAQGWKIYEVHYSCCYSEEKMLPIIEEILKSNSKLTFDYINYVPREKKKKLPKICACGNHYMYGKCCVKCASTASRKVVRPSKEELEVLVWKTPMVQLSKQFGVSDVAIAKWCKSYGIERPGRGYWVKLSLDTI